MENIIKDGEIKVISQKLNILKWEKEFEECLKLNLQKDFELFPVDKLWFKKYKKEVLSDTIPIKKKIENYYTFEPLDNSNILLGTKNINPESNLIFLNKDCMNCFSPSVMKNNKYNIKLIGRFLNGKMITKIGKNYYYIFFTDNNLIKEGLIMFADCDISLINQIIKDFYYSNINIFISRYFYGKFSYNSKFLIYHRNEFDLLIKYNENGIKSSSNIFIIERKNGNMKNLDNDIEKSKSKTNFNLSFENKHNLKENNNIKLNNYIIKENNRNNTNLNESITLAKDISKYYLKKNNIKDNKSNYSYDQIKNSEKKSKKLNNIEQNFKFNNYMKEYKNNYNNLKQKINFKQEEKNLDKTNKSLIIKNYNEKPKNEEYNKFKKEIIYENIDKKDNNYSKEKIKEKKKIFLEEFDKDNDNKNNNNFYSIKKIKKDINIPQTEVKYKKKVIKIDINLQKELAYNKGNKKEIYINSNINDKNIEKHFEIKNNTFHPEIKLNKKDKKIDFSFSNEKKYENKVIKKYNSFPKGTNYEKDLNSNFRYFNIFWYDPNKSNDFDNFKKCFENVQFYKGYDLNSTIKFFKNEFISEWIVITPGVTAVELIKNLDKVKCIKSFFIYCNNPKLYESWTKNIKKVECLISNPEDLCKKLIEINKEYLIPNFNYEKKKNNEIIPNLNSDYNFIVKSSILKEEIKEKNIIKNIYNNLCIKYIKYLCSNDIIKDFKETDVQNNSILNIIVIISKGIGEGLLNILLDNLFNLTFISLYFSRYPYVLNLLTAEEVYELLKSEKQLSFSLIEDELRFTNNLEVLCQKIMNKGSILDETDKLKELQIYLINKFALCKNLLNQIYNMNGNYYYYFQIINFFRDIDFCLKILVLCIYCGFNNKKFNFIDELNFALTFCEPRYQIFGDYLDQNEKIKKFNQKEQKILTDSLTIKEFIVIGNNIFCDKIRIIEKNFKSFSFNYLTIEQLSSFLIGKKKGVRIINYFYFLIIKYEDFEANFEKIYLLSFKFGITFIAFLFIDNDDKIKIHKYQYNSLFPIIIVYSLKDIFDYLSQKLNFENPFKKKGIEELSNILNIKIPKITFEENDEEKYQNGCFELAETFDINLIKNNFMFKYLGKIDFLSRFPKLIYDIYKEHNALDLFYKQNCLYFGWKLYPELFSSNICFVKRFLYMYCREEKKEREKSFYRIINDDLRTRNSDKIYRYIDILALIYQLIETKSLASFKGKVYRATKLDENLILKLVPGRNMINTTFWSTSKDFNVASKFMKKQNWRNSFIICQTIKNNIDIDFEELNPYNEKEVLFLPFTEFKVEKISYEKKCGRKIYTIELTELGNRNFVNSDNMQIENLNNLGWKNVMDISPSVNTENMLKIISKYFKLF